MNEYNNNVDSKKSPSGDLGAGNINNADTTNTPLGGLGVFK